MIDSLSRLIYSVILNIKGAARKGDQMARKKGTALGITQGEKEAYIRGFVAGANVSLTSIEKAAKDYLESVKYILEEGAKKDDSKRKDS